MARYKETIGSSFRPIGMMVLAALAGGCAETDVLEQAEPTATAKQAATGRLFGASYVEQFALINGTPWLGEIYSGYEYVTQFAYSMPASDTLKYRYEMRSTLPSTWHEPTDNTGNGVDAVDLFLAITHGGYNKGPGTGASWSSWAWKPVERWSVSSAMKLGNGTPGCSIFATYSCATMHDDGYNNTRWKPVFAGGLRMALGFHEDAGIPTPETGASFGQHLADGDAVTDAWFYAAEYFDPNAPAAAIAVGSTYTDCFSRLNDMTWSNFTSYSRVTSNQKYCIQMIN